MQNKDLNYEATRLHFENLVKRYGNPIIILNLIKVDNETDYGKIYVKLLLFPVV